MSDCSKITPSSTPSTVCLLRHCRQPSTSCVCSEVIGTISIERVVYPVCLSKRRSKRASSYALGRLMTSSLSTHEPLSDLLEIGTSSRISELALPTGATIDQSLSRLGVSSHIVARSQLSSDITSCTTVAKSSSVGSPCAMAFVIVMIDCARRSATRACSLLSRVSSFRSADSSASVRGCLSVSIQLASTVVKPENLASCLSSGLSLRQLGCHSRSRSCSTATSLPTLSENSPVVSSWRTAPPTS
mmetsp:Transcript_65904/g.158957  ORF Transcript_65904/g.158957 Transcript_65904/m.158957 type:complete len:245 (+) Transcript_65904:296-1030(+)